MVSTKNQTSASNPPGCPHPPNRLVIPPLCAASRVMLIQVFTSPCLYKGSSKQGLETIMFANMDTTPTHLHATQGEALSNLYRNCELLKVDLSQGCLGENLVNKRSFRCKRARLAYHTLTI